MKYIFFFTILIFVAACSSKIDKTEKGLEAELTTTLNLEVRYSRNLETVALIYNLSEAGDYQFGNNPEPRAMLARELTNKFSEFRNHEAVQKVNYLVNEGFVDLYDIVLSLYSTELPAFEQYAVYPPIYYEHDSLSPEQVQEVFNDFNESVMKFYRDAGLEDFFIQQEKGLYSKLMSEVNNIKPDEKYVSLMEDYYGIKRNSYSIIVSAFSFNGIGRSKTIHTEEGVNIFQFVASNPNDESDIIDLNNLDSFTIGYTDQDYFREVAIHELGHSFFHEALREHQILISKIDELEYLYTDSLREDMMNQGYVDWRMCFEEHLVRLGEIKIAELLGNSKFVSDYMQNCIEDRGFIYMKEIQGIMTQYEENRDKYKTIEDFIPVLIEELKTKVPNIV